MNVLQTISRGLVVAVVASVHNASAELRRAELRKTIHISTGSFLLTEKKAVELFGEERISARNQVIIGKAIWGGLVNLPADASAYRSYTNPNRSCQFLDYVIVNGGLRYVVASSDEKHGKSIEKIIEEKCDEFLPESVAWVVKPLVPCLLDLTYDYVTVQAVNRVINKADK
jgi:hypothetical protein